MSSDLECSFLYSYLRNWVIATGDEAGMGRKEVGRNKVEQNVWIQKEVLEY